MNENEHELCTCGTYGALYCRICKQYYCHDHKCFHLPSFDISFANIKQASDSEPFLHELESEEELDENETTDSDPNPFSIPSNILSLPTYALRQRQDRLFRELKAIQKELELRVFAESPEEYKKGYKRYKIRATRPSKVPKPEPLIEALKLLQSQGLLYKFIKLKESI